MPPPPQAGTSPAESGRETGRQPSTGLLSTADAGLSAQLHPARILTGTRGQRAPRDTAIGGCPPQGQERNPEHPPAARDADRGENRAESDRLHHRGDSWAHALAPMSTHTSPRAPCTPASPRAGLGAEDNRPSSPAEAALARGGFLLGSQGVSGATWPPGRVLDHRRFPAAAQPSLGYHCP